LVLLIELAPLAQPHKLLVLVCTYMHICGSNLNCFLIPYFYYPGSTGCSRTCGGVKVRILQITPVAVHNESSRFRLFNGADVVFRNVLVPLAGQREALLLKDARSLAKTMCKQLPASRHGEAGEAIAEAFLVEAKMQK
jgi:hypothetical protein